MILTYTVHYNGPWTHQLLDWYILRSRQCSVNVVDDSDWDRIINSGWLYQPVKCRNIFNGS